MDCDCESDVLGIPLDLHDDIFLVERRSELLTKAHEQHCSAHEQKRRAGDHRQGRTNGCGQCGPIEHLQAADE